MAKNKNSIYDVPVMTRIDDESYQEHRIRFDALVELNQNLPNFPLYAARDQKFTDAIKEIGLDQSLDYSSTMHNKMQRAYPGMPRNTEATRRFYQLHHSEPVIFGYDDEEGTVDLLFHSHAESAFYTMQINAHRLKDILDNQIIMERHELFRMHKEQQKEKPYMGQFPLSLHMMEDVCAANSLMALNFTKETGIFVNDLLTVEKERSTKLQDYKQMTKDMITFPVDAVPANALGKSANQRLVLDHRRKVQPLSLLN